MIRRLTVTAVVGMAAAAALVAGVAPGAVASPQINMAAMVTPARPGPPPPPHHDNSHGPGWDGHHGNWDGRSGFGRGGGWDGNGGGWDGHHWWVNPDRCNRGHGHVVGDPHHGGFCRGGLFNGAPVHF